MTLEDDEKTKGAVELLALIERLQFGKLKVELDVHNGIVKGLEVEGHKRIKYAKDNLKAVQDIITRIKKSYDAKESTRLMFMIDIRSGNIDQTIWLSTIKRRYDTT